MSKYTKKIKLPVSIDVFLSILAGTEAGIATTAAIIVGLTIGTDDRGLVVISALISIIVQAFNSSLTTIFTAHTLDEIEHNRDMNSLLQPISQGALQFVTHVTAGLFVLLPIIYVDRLEVAMLTSIGVSLVLLLWIGLFVGRVVRHTPLRNSIQSFVLGVMIIIGGFLAGFIIN